VVSVKCGLRRPQAGKVQSEAIFIAFPALGWSAQPPTRFGSRFQTKQAR
jgi:hypothetical protein